MLGKIMRFIDNKRNEKIEEKDLLRLYKFDIDRPKIFKATADADTILDWDRIFNDSCNDTLPESIRATLLSCITKSTYNDDRFDFGKIDSLTCSKSFGQSWVRTVNGSWFNTIADWGRAMYPSQNLSGLTNSDLEGNIAHIELEGFSTRSPLNIKYFSWLDRYICSNSGGSHHAAMLSYQLKHSKLSYHRAASIVNYECDYKPIIKLEELGYYFIIIGGQGYSDSSFEKLDSREIMHELVRVVCEFRLRNATPNDSRAYLFHQSDIILSDASFISWYRHQLEKGSIWRLSDIMKNPVRYCTSPYLHEVDYISLGDPCRKSDIAKLDDKGDILHYPY